MKCELKCDQLPFDQWQDLFAKTHRATLLQSYDYARAVLHLNGQKPAWAVIYIDDQPAGLVQIAQASVMWRLIHAVIVDRGPLWFDGYGAADHMYAFMRAFNKSFPKRFGRKRRIIPEYPDDKMFHDQMRALGWQRVSGSSYQTVWLDLTQEEGALYKSLRKSWRQSLTKADKSGLAVEWDDHGKTLPLHLKSYALDKAQKGYGGPDLKIIQPLCLTAAKSKNLLLATAFLDKKPVAGIIIICHGRAATYQVGWSSDKGKSACAHHKLLWESALALKARGINDFDLGGMNETTAKSLKTFKTGLGGQAVTLAGLYT